MYRPKDTQERILHRLKIAQGHLAKVLKMAENNEYCIDVIHQSQAVQRALEEADSLVLENHLRTCASDAIKKGRQGEAIKEIMNVFRRSKVSFPPSRWTHGSMNKMNIINHFKLNSGLFLSSLLISC